MTYNPTKTYSVDIENETRVLGANLVQLNLELISQETKALQGQINVSRESLNENQKMIKKNTSNFMHDFLFLG